MARVFIESFERGTLNQWDITNGWTMYASAGAIGMDGTYCAYCDASTPYLIKSFTGLAELYMAFLYRPKNNSANIILSFRNGSTNIGSLRRNTSSTFLEARRGTTGGTLLATGSTGMVLNTTYLIEIYFKPHSTTGVFQVKVNGIAFDINFSGQTTDSPTSIDSIRFGGDGTLISAYFYLDNVIIDDAGWIGSTKIVSLVPTASGDLIEWTPLAGSNYENIDETPPSDAEFNLVNANDQTDLFELGAIPGAAYQVRSVQIYTRFVKEGTATPTKIRPVFKTGGTLYEGLAEVSVPTSYLNNFNLLSVNPVTGIAWTIDEINALQLGYKSRA